MARNDRLLANGDLRKRIGLGARIKRVLCMGVVCLGRFDKREPFVLYLEGEQIVCRRFGRKINGLQKVVGR